jgi:hypothetical protein
VVAGVAKLAIRARFGNGCRFALRAGSSPVPGIAANGESVRTPALRRIVLQRVSSVNKPRGHKMQESTEQTRGNVPDPKVLAFLICEDVIVDTGTKRKTIVNVTDQINAVTYPALCPKLHLFAQVTAGHGTKQIEMKLVFASTNEQVSGVGANGQVSFLDPLQVIDLIVPIVNLILPREGEYRFQFFSAGTLLVEQRLTAKTIKVKPIQGPDSDEHSGD